MRCQNIVAAKLTFGTAMLAAKLKFLTAKLSLNIVLLLQYIMVTRDVIKYRAPLADYCSRLYLMTGLPTRLDFCSVLTFAATSEGAARARYLLFAD